MRLTRRQVGGAVVAATLAFWAARAGWLPVPRASGPLTHSAYVWQHDWNPSVSKRVAAVGGSFERLTALAAEVAWNGEAPRVKRIALDFSALRSANRPVALAIRVSELDGEFTEASPALAALSELAASVINESIEHGIPPAALQLDFDCPESRLDGYRSWVLALKNRIAPTPLTLTALPSWLDRPAFKRLMKAADGYTLQVHSLERPASIAAPATLCSPEAAREAVEQAGRLGIPFDVALPTCGYTLAFAPSGSFLGLSSDGLEPSWPVGVLTREVRADPEAIARLVQGWQTDRPEAFHGLIWYRLPMPDDRLNWRWPTLAAVLEGAPMQTQIETRVRWLEPELAELEALNSGALDGTLSGAARATWTGGRLVAGGAAEGTSLTRGASGEARFQMAVPASRLPAGARRRIGWLRFEGPVEVKLEWL